jgi:hypothetical protein
VKTKTFQEIPSFFSIKLLPNSFHSNLLLSLLLLLLMLLLLLLSTLEGSVSFNWNGTEYLAETILICESERIKPQTTRSSLSRSSQS